jgi:hypothetical protein
MYATTAILIADQLATRAFLYIRRPRAATVASMCTIHADKSAELAAEGCRASNEEVFHFIISCAQSVAPAVIEGDFDKALAWLNLARDMFGRDCDEVDIRWLGSLPSFESIEQAQYQGDPEGTKEDEHVQ